MTAFCPSIPLLSSSTRSSIAGLSISNSNVKPLPTRPSRAARWTATSTRVQSTSSKEVQRLPDDFLDNDQVWNMKGSRMSKIVCTIGPKTCDVNSIEQLAETGMDIVRLNMSHGTHEWHSKVIENVRELNSRGRFNLGILLDTKGPEVRSGDLKSPLKVKRGEKFTWTIRKDVDNFDSNTVDVSYDDFVHDVKVGDTLLIDGGMCSFLVNEVTETDVISECVDGGTLTSRRHLNVRGKSASLPAITDKDWEDIDFGLRMNVDFYALSFVKHESDVSRLIEHLRERGSKALVLSKIESADAVGRLRPILEASDGAMVARGDLGAEIPIEDVPLIQDEIVAINREIRKPTIVATHMLESMITYPTPTRAEVADITEAVRQGADATMLSGETANGSYPLKALNVMATVAESVVSRDNAMGETDLFSPLPIATAASSLAAATSLDDPNTNDARVDLAHNAATLASRLKVAVIVVFTRRGSYARLISASRPRCPIVALSPDPDLVRRITILWGMKPFEMQFSEDPEQTVADAVNLLLEKQLVCRGDNIVIMSDMVSKGNKTVDSIQVRRVH